MSLYDWVCQNRDPCLQLSQLSQEGLADLARIGRSYMSGIERGVRNCSALHLLRLAKALRVPVGELFSE